MEPGEVIVYVESGRNLCKRVGLSFHQFRNVCNINECLKIYRPYCLDAGVSALGGVCAGERGVGVCPGGGLPRGVSAQEDADGKN